MSEREPPDPLARLGERIDKARAQNVRNQPAVGDRSATQQGLGLGLRIGIELVVAIGVATGLGWARIRGTTTRTDVAIELRPLEQFTIERIIPIHIGGLDLSYTNAALMMTMAVIFATALMVLATRRAALVPGRWQSIAEMLYEFVADMVDSNIGQGGRQFFPFVFTLFAFILFANLLGMIP